jgi:hypothetical protein
MRLTTTTSRPQLPLSGTTTLDWTCPTQCHILSIPPPQGQNTKLKPHKVDQEFTAASFSTPLPHAVLTGYMMCTIPQRGILGIPHAPAYVGAASVQGEGLANIVAQGAFVSLYTLIFPFSPIVFISKNINTTRIIIRSILYWHCDYISYTICKVQESNIIVINIVLNLSKVEARGVFVGRFTDNELFLHWKKRRVRRKYNFLVGELKNLLCIKVSVRFSIVLSD